jgi:hypothetical protein
MEARHQQILGAAACRDLNDATHQQMMCAVRKMVWPDRLKIACPGLALGSASEIPSPIPPKPSFIELDWMQPATFG